MNVLIVGGSGYIGHSLARHLQALQPESSVVLADLKTPPGASPFRYVRWDVREPAPRELSLLRPDWIFNFAAIHREPGHEPEEYFDTNIEGARHVCALATATGCRNLFFTSSIAVYGPTRGATEEDTTKYPITPYGISKYIAEQLHQEWQASDPSRRLVICRPGVIYGPGETGNIPRMVKAIKRGLFAFPGSRTILKSYGYIEGLLESIGFTTGLDGGTAKVSSRFIYNYVESPTEPLGRLVELIAAELKVRTRVLSIPLWLLLPAASLVQFLTAGKSGIHPARVKKAATPTQIIPRALITAGFSFRYPFAESLRHWRERAPGDF